MNESKGSESDGTESFSMPSFSKFVPPPFEKLADHVPNSVDTGSSQTPPFAGFVPPPIEELANLIPEYEILEFIDKGGMGAVYKARQKRLDRLVAVKLLPPNLGDTVGLAKRFKREALAMAKLNHPHIVTVHDFGETSLGHLYIVMEYVEGTDLRWLIHAKKLQSTEILPLICQVCEAIQCAHDHGIIHRDIKPANILIDTHGHAKVADFGLAKLRENGIDLSAISSPNCAMGTPAYMAPETLSPGEEGESEVDHRADIFSLGVMIYEMLTGSVPSGAWEPPSKCVGADKRFDDVVYRAMQPNREQRYQQVSEISGTFSGSSRRRSGKNSQSANGVSKRRGAGLWIAGTVISIVILSGYFLYSLNRNNGGFTFPFAGAAVFGDARVLTPGRSFELQRSLAQWVLNKGGVVNIQSDGNDSLRFVDYSQAVNSPGLPEQPFEVWRINLQGQAYFSDDDLRQLVIRSNGLSSLRNLNLKSTAITSEGLAHLGALADHLKELSIENTPAVVDSGVPHLGKLQNLQILFISPLNQQTGAGASEITEEGKSALAEALPKCSVKWR